MEKYIFVYNANKVITEYYMTKYTNPLAYAGKSYIELEINIEIDNPIFKAIDRRVDAENNRIVFGYRKLVQPEDATIISLNDINWTEPTDDMTEEEVESLRVLNKEIAKNLADELRLEEERLRTESKMVFIRQGHYDYKTHTVVDYPEVV